MVSSSVLFSSGVELTACYGVDTLAAVSPSITSSTRLGNNSLILAIGFECRLFVVLNIEDASRTMAYSLLLDDAYEGLLCSLNIGLLLIFWLMLLRRVSRTKAYSEVVFVV